MVYVSLDDIHVERLRYLLRLYVDMSVIGFVPNDHGDVMDFLPKVFEKMRIPYLSIPHGKLHDLGYMVAELARGKIYLATIPEDTYQYHYDACVNRGFEDCEPVHVYVDVGSPFRHFFHVHRESPRFGSDVTYRVYGVRYGGTECVELVVDFFRALPWCTASFCTEEYVEAVERLAEDREIHIGIYPGACEETRRLARALLDLARRSVKPTT